MSQTETMRIEIDKPNAAGEHAMRLRTERGEEARHQFKLPHGDPKVDSFLTALLYAQTVVLPSEDDIAEFGSIALATLIGKDEAAGLFNAALRRANQRITLCIDAEATAALAFPWEFMADQSGLPLLRRHSLRRVLVAMQALPEIKVTGRLKMLLAGALPQELAEAYPINIAEHFAALRSELQPLIDNGTLELVEDPHLTPQRLHQYASDLQPHIIHLLCHGVQPITGKTVLVLENSQGGRQDLSAIQLALALETAQARLVVINGCHSSEIQGHPWHSIAPRLLNNGVPAIVAAQSALGQTAAQLFSAELYRGLLQGQTLDECIARGRRALIINDSTNVDWGLLTLYSRAKDDLLFDPTSLQPAQAQPDAAAFATAQPLNQPANQSGTNVSINFGNNARLDNSNISIGDVGTIHKTTGAAPAHPAASSLISPEEQNRQSLRERRTILQARLAHLQKQMAVEGDLNADFKLVYEINQVAADIRAIDEQLG